MAIVTDGGQAYALADELIAGADYRLANGFVPESFTENFTSTRVDLNDSNGEPIGSTIVPGRVEFSATVQQGAGTYTPAVGDIVIIDDQKYVLTEVGLTETQADYRKFNLSGYVRINGTVPINFRKVANSDEDFQITGQSASYKQANLTSLSSTTITTSSLNIMQAYTEETAVATQYQFTVSQGGTADSGNSSMTGGTIVAMSDTIVRFTISTTASSATLNLKYT